jgi:hypothetical protein
MRSLASPQLLLITESLEVLLRAGETTKGNLHRD